MSREQLEGAAHEFVPGYEKELQRMIVRRMRVLSPEPGGSQGESTQSCGVYENAVKGQQGWQEES